MGVQWNKYKVGTTVVCGFCGIEHTIEKVGVYNGGAGFELACGHRNGYCEKCDILVLDTTANTKRVTPECPFCTFH